MIGGSFEGTAKDLYILCVEQYNNYYKGPSESHSIQRKHPLERLVGRGLVGQGERYQSNYIRTIRGERDLESTERA